MKACDNKAPEHSGGWLWTHHKLVNLPAPRRSEAGKCQRRDVSSKSWIRLYCVFQFEQLHSISPKYERFLGQNRAIDPQDSTVDLKHRGK